MSTVVVERSFAEPMDLEVIQAMADRAAGCLEAHRVRFLKTYLSRDRRRMTSLYEAIDAESVRVVQEEAGVPFDRAWPARVIRFPGPEPVGDVVLVERTLPGAMDEAAIRDAAAKGAGCLEQWSCRVVWSYLSGDGHRCLCIYEAPDTESVRQSQRGGILPFERAWPSTVHLPPSS